MKLAGLDELDKYDRLWRLLDEQGISKDAVRKAAGLTALAFSKIENNTSISIEALLKVCAVLCSLVFHRSIVYRR